MFEFDIDENIVAEERLIEDITNLNTINYQIAELKMIKERVERKIVSDMKLANYDEKGHVTSVVHDGEQTRVVGKFKVKVKTPSLYKVDTKEYEIVQSQLSKEFNPIKKSISYRVDKKVLETIRAYASTVDQDLVESFLILDYSKPAITLTLNV